MDWCSIRGLQYMSSIGEEKKIHLFNSNWIQCIELVFNSYSLNNNSIQCIDLCLISLSKSCLIRCSFNERHKLGEFVQHNLWLSNHSLHMVWQHSILSFSVSVYKVVTHSFWSCKYELLEMWQCQWCHHSFRISLKRKCYHIQWFSYTYANWI